MNILRLIPLLWVFEEGQNVSQRLSEPEETGHRSPTTLERHPWEESSTFCSIISLSPPHPSHTWVLFLATLTWQHAAGPILDLGLASSPTLLSPTVVWSEDASWEPWLGRWSQRKGSSESPTPLHLGGAS